MKRIALEIKTPSTLLAMPRMVLCEEGYGAPGVMNEIISIM
jgi:hypothetical protein